MTQRHWDEAYSGTAIERTGWYEETPTISLALIDECRLSPQDSIVDIGAGASTLVDRLLDRGFENLAVLDISGQALDHLRQRLSAEDAGRVRFIRTDVTAPDVGSELGPVMLWHDRATLHFLAEGADCDRYARTLQGCVAPGGYAVLATYALHGAPT
ncbi:MAG: class I SAM-dependent methyltransferase [Chloroflexi bacterium]|nr:class I SAM-dependent methyltransferase [Chloroflexota bacterium]MDA1147655.1 class I SAM-dependent methyltransferase [Chloroflexota bacterium]